MCLKSFLTHRSHLLGILGVTLVFACLSSPAFAAGENVFGGFGNKLWDIGQALIDNVGRGAMLLGGAWAVLAWMGKLGYFSAAVSVFIGGIFLSQLPDLVKFFFA